MIQLTEPFMSNEATSTLSHTIWQTIRDEATREITKEKTLENFFITSILDHQSLAEALAFLLAQRLATTDTPATTLAELFKDVFSKDSAIIDAIIADLLAVQQRDSACRNTFTPMLFYKGFLALQAWRISHYLWENQRKPVALFLQNRISCELGVDIHPAAKIGSGIMMDHATGIVIGETATVGNNVSIMQSVTLGGTGKENGDRHPKVGNGVLISAGAKILGNIKIGDGAKIGAGSVVLHDVEPHTTVAGVPAVQVGKPHSDAPALEMDHRLSDQ
jgi:serine O-acetyltransferase